MIRSFVRARHTARACPCVSLCALLSAIRCNNNLYTYSEWVEEIRQRNKKERKQTSRHIKNKEINIMV